jgi:hypothetical protein
VGTFITLFVPPVCLSYIDFILQGETSFESTDDKEEFLSLVKTFQLNIDIPQVGRLKDSFYSVEGSLR